MTIKTFHFFKAGTRALKDAENEAGQAALLYRDALSDLVRSIQAKANAEQASISLEQAAVQLAIAQQRAIYEVARAKGDEAGATQAANEIRKLEIQLAELSAKAKRAEAQAALAVVAAKRAELESNGEYVGVKRLEIEAAEKAAQVKLKEAEIAEVTAKQMRDLADAHRTAGNEANRSSGGFRSVALALGEHEEAMDRIMMKYKLSADYSERQIALLEREAAAAERAAEAYRKKWNIDKDGFTLDANGNRMQQSLPTGNYVYETAKSQGLDEAKALELMDKFFRNGQGVGTEKGTDWFSTVNKAIAELVIEEARKRAAQGPALTSQTTNVQPTGPQSSAAAVSYVNNITIPGVGQATTRHADEQSARSEVDLLRRLATAKGVSSGR